MPAAILTLSGEPVLLMGYPTGIDAILARADEATLRGLRVQATGS